MKKVLEILKVLGMWITLTHYGRMLSLLVLAITFSMLNDKFEWAYYPAVGCAITLLGYVLIAIVFAWIINPLRAWKSRRKK